MGCRIPESKRQLVKAKIELKHRPKTISKETNVSVRAVQVFKKNLRDYGTLRPPKLVPQGRPRSITAEMQEVSHFFAGKSLTKVALGYALHTSILVR
jgi:hypothetical protein